MLTTTFSGETRTGVLTFYNSTNGAYRYYAAYMSGTQVVWNVRTGAMSKNR